MKIWKIALFLLCASTSGFAQPTLTTAQLPQNGDVLIRTYLDMQNLTVGPGGANVTWDYSMAEFSRERDSGVYMAAVPLQPQVWNYNQQFRFEKTLFSGQIVTYYWYDYYINSPDSFSRAGWDYGVPDIHPIEYRNAAPQLRFPMTYLDSFDEPMGGSQNTIGGPVTFSGRSYVDADGYGTLILPDTSWQGVLRVHTRDTIFGPGGNFLFNSTYYFYHPSRVHPLLAHCDVDGLNGYAWLGSDELLLVPSVEEAAFSAAVYPNPADEYLRIDLGRAGPVASLRLMDVKGQTVLSGKINGITDFSVKSLEPGMYFIEVTLPNGRQYRQKQVVMH